MSQQYNYRRNMYGSLTDGSCDEDLACNSMQKWMTQCTWLVDLDSMCGGGLRFSSGCIGCGMLYGVSMHKNWDKCDGV